MARHAGGMYTNGASTEETKKANCHRHTLLDMVTVESVVHLLLPLQVTKLALISISGLYMLTNHGLYS